MIKILQAIKSWKQQRQQAGLKADPGKLKKRKSSQARRNNDSTAIELQWIQQVLAIMSAHRKRSTLVLLVLVLVSTPLWIGHTQWLPIEKIVLNGRFEQVNMQQLESDLQAYLGQGFFSVNIQTIQQQVLSQPWIEKVSVRRVWPNQLKVSVLEKTAVARWDSNHLLSNHGKVFEASADRFKHLPRIHGYRENSMSLLQRYLQMQQQFDRVGLTLTELSEDRKGATSLTLGQNLKVNLGSEKNDSKIQHLLTVYGEQIKPRFQHIKTIDFRYSNGFAIAWKEEYLKQQQVETQTRGNRNV